jgi:lysophospholipase L1-like esterase
MVAGVDAALGELIASLEAQGRAERTLIVFTSDNGGLSAHARGTTPRGTGRDTHCWPLREGKGSAYEGGTRVPMVVAWAKSNPEHPLQQAIRVAAGRRCAAPILCEDLFATLIRLGGASVQDIEEAARQKSVAQPEVDGRDLTELLADGDQPDRLLLFHYPHVWGPHGAGYQPHSALLVDQHKVIYFYQPRRWELYDLRNDLGESNDLAESQPELLSRLAHELIRQLRDKDALYPTNRDTGDSEELVVPSSEAALKPIPSSEDRAAAAGWTAGGTWLDQHEDINRIAAEGQLDLVLLGDSITQSWGGPGRNVATADAKLWDEFFSDRRAANFGISGDRTQHLLWRIAHGNLAGIDPKAVVVLIGTNNLADDSAEEIAAGIELIVRRIEEKLPQAKIVLCSILPRGESSDPLGAKARAVNEQIAPLANQRTTIWLDLTPSFVDADGGLRSELYSGDKLHLSIAGYREWGEALRRTLAPFNQNR